MNKKEIKSRKIIGLGVGGEKVVPLTVGEGPRKIVGLYVDNNVVLPKQDKKVKPNE